MTQQVPSSNMVSLQSYNTFGVKASCDELITVTSVSQLQELCKASKASVVILGGGSNTLFVNSPKTVWNIAIEGKELVKEREDAVIIRVGAGEDWHNLVTYCVNQNWGGIENLALIPGKCGAAPIQNIGAYGVEIKDVLQSVSVVERATGNRLEFHVSELGLGYRQSYFKQDWKDKFILDSIVLRLTKDGHHEIRSHYGAIQSTLQSMNVDRPTLHDIYTAVVQIRSSKLPDPKEIGNAGSFFKNPIITKSQFDELLKHYPEMPSYPVDDTTVKVPAGWLIDQAGWKGKQVGNVGAYAHQALVIVNHGDADGTEVFNFSKQIQESIHELYGIELQREINVV